MSAALGIGLAGLGTVGAALVEHLSRHRDRLPGISLRAVSARRKERNPPLPPGIDFVPEAGDLARRDDLDVIVELIGGAQDPAHRLVSAALDGGKHVVTANKALLARHGASLAARAEKAGVALGFEAACAAALPVVKVLRETCAASPVTALDGILNGTCNYVLCEMEATGRAFGEVLAEAQAKGYAEADPALDIGGHDAAQKLALLGALAFGVAPDETAIAVEGIGKVRILDIRLADMLGCKLRLLAHARKQEGGVAFRVRPALAPASSRLAGERGTRNVLAIRSRSFGTLVLEGQGAGGAPTASAVAADLADIAAGRWARHPFGIPAADLADAAPAAPPAAEEACYIRVLARDEAGSMAQITRRISEAGLSLTHVVQPGTDLPLPSGEAPAGSAPIAMITHPAASEAVARARARLADCPGLAGPAVFYPVEADPKERIKPRIGYE